MWLKGVNGSSDPHLLDRIKSDWRTSRQNPTTINNGAELCALWILLKLEVGRGFIKPSGIWREQTGY